MLLSIFQTYFRVTIIKNALSSLVVFKFKHYDLMWCEIATSFSQITRSAEAINIHFFQVDIELYNASILRC